MATDQAGLTIVLEASSKKLQNQLVQVTKKIDQFAAANERRFRQMSGKNEAAFATLGKTAGASLARANALLGALGFGVTIKGVMDLSDAFTTMQNQLKVAGLAGKDLQTVYQSLFQVAQKNGVSIQDLVTVYSRASSAAKELGADQNALIKFTSNVATAMRVSGSSTEAAQGALLQLSQLLGGTMVQAQEYNSLIDGARPILVAVAAGLKEAGGSVGKLTQLVKAGKVPTKAFFDAFQAGAPILDQQVAGSQTTIAQGFVKIQNALTDAVGEFNASTGAANNVATAFTGIAAAIDGVDVRGFIQKLKDARTEADDFFSHIGNSSFFEWLNQVSGVTPDTMKAAGLVPVNKTDSVAATFDTLGTQSQNTGLDNALSWYAAGNRGGGIKPVSLKSYPVTPTGTGKSNPYASATASLAKRTAELQAQTKAQAALNPLVNDYGFAVDKAKASADLLAAAQKAGIPITDDLKAKIDVLATGYATADVASKQLAESQEHLTAVAGAWRDTVKGATGTFIDDLVQGKSAADALGDALTQIGNQLLQMGLDQLFGGGTFGNPSQPFGILGSLFFHANGGIAANGKPVRRYAGGGVAKSASIFGEAGPEAAVPLPDGRRIPVDLRMPSPAGGAVTAPIHVTIDASGADSAAVARLQQSVAQMKHDLPATVVGAVRDAKKRRRL